MWACLAWTTIESNSMLHNYDSIKIIRYRKRAAAVLNYYQFEQCIWITIAMHFNNTCSVNVKIGILQYLVTLLAPGQIVLLQS